MKKLKNTKCAETVTFMPATYRLYN